MQGTATAKPPVADRRMLLIALILAAAAAGLIVAFLATRSSDDPGPKPISEKLVVVAARDIPLGKKIEAADVTTRSIPDSAVLTGAYEDRAAVIGLTVRYPMTRGEQFAPARVITPFSDRPPSAHIPQGMRGMTVPVTITHTVARLLVTGDYVDVIVTATLNLIGPELMPTAQANAVATPGANEPEPKDFAGAVTLIQNVQVLGIEGNYPQDVEIDPEYRGTFEDEKDIRFVTLIVTPEQAQLLWLAVDQGKITLILRGQDDNEILNLPPVAEPVRLEPLP